MTKAVFLDRDGVLCEDTNYITSIQQIKLFSFTIPAIALLKKMNYLTIVITNQSAVARGFMSLETLASVNGWIKNACDLDEVYFCPHLPPSKKHPEMSFNPMRIVCSCRKPGTGMFEKAIRKYKIDVTQSYMVGDRESDIMAGKRAGTKTVLVMSGNTQQGKIGRIQPDYIYDNLYLFAQALFNQQSERGGPDEGELSSEITGKSEQHGNYL